MKQDSPVLLFPVFMPGSGAGRNTVTDMPGQR